MVKRDNGTQRTNGGTTTVNASGATMADAMEQRAVTLAEQLRRFAGTVQAQAEGRLDREALNKRIASVRDGAAARGGNKGRSDGGGRRSR